MSISFIICRRILFTITCFLSFHFISAQDLHCNEDTVSLLQAQRLFEKGNYDSSVLFYEKYLSMSALSYQSSYLIPDQKTKRDKVKYLQVLLHLGTSYNMISKPGNALFVLNSGLEIIESEAIDEPGIKALLFYQIGNAYLLELDYKNSIRNYQNALALAGNDTVLVTKINQNLGAIFFFTEDYDNAIEHYQKALVSLSLKRSADPITVARLLINTGSAFVEKQEYIKAAEYFSEAETLITRINITDLQEYARLSQSLGKLMMKMNRPKEALEQYRKATQLYQIDRPAKPDEMILLYSNIAQLCRKQLEFDSTIHYYNLAVSLIPAKTEGFDLVFANLFRNLGETYGMKKNWDTALNYYQKALEVLIPSDPDSLETSALKTRNPITTLELFRISHDRARTLYQKGIDKGSDDFVLQSFNEYLSAIESINLINKEFGREGSRLLFNESVKDLYYGALETGYHLLSHNHQELNDQLFIVNEKSRNKILLSGYMDHIAKRLSGVPDSISKKEIMLNEDISICIKNLEMDPPVTVRKDSDTYLFYLNKLIELRWGIDSLKIKYENSSPLYRKIKEQATANTYKKIKQHLVTGEALVEYFIGDTSLFIFVARSDSLIIRRIHVSSDLVYEISGFSKEIRLAEQQNLYESGHDLYCKLILPVKSSLNDIKKLIIIPDETLATIPFEALVSDLEPPVNNSSSFHPTYLLNDFEVSYQFSSSLWVNSRRDDRLDPESLTYAGFAPVNFSFEKKIYTNHDNEISFRSLPFSKLEINEISGLILKNRGETHLFIEQRATEKNFRNSLEDCSIIHLATHSMINDQQPELSGLVFFPDKNEEKERSDFDGIMYLEEIFNLRMDPDLLVLSACATGMGKITRSEGVLAMTRGFFMAGASNIIFTLWNVSDKYTKDFMVSFFDGLLAGQTYSGALRNAKINMISTPETSLPRLWAPYVLLGQ